jgi:hypothetical protein
MWKVHFNIVDKIREREDYAEYILKNSIKFRDIFDMIGRLYPEYQDGENITLLLYHEGKKKLVREFDLYIRVADTIEIIISRESYFLCNVQGYEIESSENIGDLYVIYHRLNLSCELFIVKIENDKLFLVDVLDSGSHFYNDCVNRLISRYNF